MAHGYPEGMTQADHDREFGRDEPDCICDHCEREIDSADRWCPHCDQLQNWANRSHEDWNDYLAP